MRAPAHWWRQKPSPVAHLLRPPSLLYGAIAGWRMRRSGTAAEVPVVCVGNFTVGGAGKTPAALALARMLAAEGQQPFFLTRGYGGRLPGPVRVDAGTHNAADVGDEPLLLARAFPTVMARDRPAGAGLAAREGASVIVMDDGLQNSSLAKDLALAIVDGATGVGNGLCLPAGPLRAPLRTQWRKVDAVIVVGEGAPGAALARQAVARDKPVFRARLEPDAAAAGQWRGRKVLAFAGIGQPDKFFATLQRCGAVVVRRKAFPDHHPYGADEIRAVLAEAKAADLQAVTTEKDFARIAALPGAAPPAGTIRLLPVRLVFDNEKALCALARERLAAWGREASRRPQ
jgi:tetraacyldisaccharide 4'-kinase